MAKVTEKNTKKEIMDYVKELEIKLSEKAEVRKTTADIQKEVKVKEIKESAAKLITTGIVNEKTEAQYNNLLETISLLDKELKEVYEIKRNVHTLEALIIAHEDKSDELSKEYDEKLNNLQEIYANKKTDHDKLIKDAQEKYEKLVKELNNSYFDEKEKQEKERKREREEFVYNLKRERAIENDKWFDEKAAREKELATKEAMVTTRELEVTLTEQAEAEYKQTIIDLKAMTVKEREEAFLEGKAKAKKEAETSKVFSDKAHKAELDRKQDALESITRSNTELRQSNDMLQAKLDEAYTRIQNMAIEAAKSASGIRMVEPINK